MCAAAATVLVGIWLWLAFSSGGYLAREWVLPVLALGLFGLAAAALTAYPRRPRQLSLAVLAVFGAYAIWVACSAIWAGSTGRVWLESGRTFAYLLILALALTYFTSAAARVAFRYLLMGGAFLLLVVCISRLWSAQNIADLFSGGRLRFPAGYPNNSAAMFLVCFWPLMWLAAGPRERAPVRGIAVGVATGLLGLAIMTQSRGAIYSLAISLVLLFVLSPGRLRLLFYLLVPVLLMGYAFPRLNRYWLDGPEAVGGGQAARTVLIAALAAGFIGMILALLERWVRVSGRMKVIFGAVIAVACLAGLVYGATDLTRPYGGPIDWFSHTWQVFTADPASGETTGSSSPTGTSGSRFTDLSSNGRVDIWKAAWREFESSPVVGAGAGNFVYQYERVRAVTSNKPQETHSITLQVLGDTGIVGGIFAFGGIILAVSGILWPRLSASWARARRTWLRRKKQGEEPAGSRSGQPPTRWGDDAKAYGWEMALLAGAAYWFIHANVEWLWQMAGVSIAAVLMLAAGVAAADARAGVMWPRACRWLRRKGSARQDGVRAHAEAEGAATGTGQADSLAGVEPHEYTQHSSEPLSLTFRIGLIVLSVVVLLLAGFAFLSMQIQTSALALSRTDPLTAAGRAASARWLAPGDASPYVTQASIYGSAAREALASQQPDRAGAVLDDLALAISAHEKAIAKQSADWTNYYRAAWATLDLLAAKAYAEGRGGELEAVGVTKSFANQHDWSGLAGVVTVPAVGAATGSLAQGEASVQAAHRYRALSQKQLFDLASGFIGAADERNPLEPTVDEAIQLLQKLSTM